MIYEFGAHRFDATTGDLRRDGARVPLRRQTAALLADLIARRARWVTRAELCTRIWGGLQTSASSYSTLVCELRAAVLDDGRRQRVIRTRRGRGYRFVAPVHAARGAASPAAAVRDAEASKPLDEAPGCAEAHAAAAERSLEAARIAGPRQLVVHGPGAHRFVADWARVARDRGLEVLDGRPGCDSTSPLGQWVRIATRAGRVARREGDAPAMREWARIEASLAWLSTSQPGARAREHASFFVADGLARALLRHARRRSAGLCVVCANAGGPRGDGLLQRLRCSTAPVALWLLSPAPAGVGASGALPRRTDVVVLAPGSTRGP